MEVSCLQLHKTNVAQKYERLELDNEYAVLKHRVQRAKEDLEWFTNMHKEYKAAE